MNESAKIAQANAHSITHWWQMAGVDYAVKDAPHNWLAEPEPAPPSVAQPEQPARQERVTPPLPSVRSETPPADWPQDLAQLKAAIAAGAALPGNGFGGKSVAPIGDAGADLMIIMDLPSAEDIELSRLSSGATGQLLEKMIAAMGQEISDCYITALATTRPAIGEIPQGDDAGLAAFMFHQMHIVKPKAVLILGTAACQALLNAELMTARQNLHYFNHDGQKVTAITTFHPRTLLARPILKAQAWKDLQMLMKKGAL